MYQYTVEIPLGTAKPGCEETNDCYIPSSLKITSSETVKWVNLDKARHTVSSGNPIDGPKT